MRRSHAGSRCTRSAPPTSSRSGSTAATCPRATAGAFPPATRSGSGSARSTPAFTSRSRPCAWPRTSTARPSATRATGFRTSCATATADGVFFVGDSAGHCLPLTAEGIRTAFYFGIACGRELRRVVEGRAERRDRPAALRRLLRSPRVAVRVDAAHAEGRPAGAAAPAGGRAARRSNAARSCDWSFDHYLKIAHPSFAQAPGPAAVWTPTCPSPPSGGQRTIRNVPASNRTTPAIRSTVIGCSSSPRMPSRSMTTESVSWPVIVAAATPPAPIVLTVTRAVNT